jgi:GTP-binding protein HflX
MEEYYNTVNQKERAVLIGVIEPFQDEKTINEYLDELEFLADTAGAEPVKRFIQRIESPNARTYIGEGKVSEIKRFIDEKEINLVLFDDELSPTQLRNVEKEFGVKVLDRTNLILDIFAHRAKTAYAKTQVELAQYEYLLPRLTGMWTHLERQKGGIGLRGPGEREIETDRRVIRSRISKLKEDLKKIDKQMATQRKNRGRFVRVALVGYTNVGKSTLMNLLSKADIFAENKLFATLDTTVRKVVIGNLPFLLSDTVGFIRKLPHHLVESFKSTLDELRESDILLHVVDISHPNFAEQIDVVKQTLLDMGTAEKPTYMVFNKIDAYTHIEKDADDLSPRVKENITLDEMKLTWMARMNTPCLFISATEKTNIEEFKNILYAHVREIHTTRYPYDNLLYPDIEKYEESASD